MNHRCGFLIVGFALMATSACDRMRGGTSGGAHPAQVPTDQALDRVPLGAPPGEAVNIASTIDNPYEGDAAAVSQGKQLFGSMNCVYCHGERGVGLIGPSLQGPAWRYGGTPAEIYKSIAEGRPQGMPAWGSRLPPDEIWKLVAYVESQGGAQPPATARTVEAGGPRPSQTGPQPADQSPQDSSHEALVRAQQSPGPSG